MFDFIEDFDTPQGPFYEFFFEEVKSGLEVEFIGLGVPFDAALPHKKPHIF